MAKRIRPEENQFLKVLLYGQPGSTKTRTAATAEWDDRSAPAIQFDIGGNTLSIRDYKQQPDLILIEKLAELNPFYNWLSQGQPANSPLVSQFELRPPYKTVILDGVTDVQRTVMNEASGNANTPPATMPAPMEIQHYGKVLRTMTNLASLFFKLPMHVIITALERRDQDAMQQIYFGPLLLGQSAMEVAGYAYVVGRMMHIERIGAVDRKDMQRAAAAAKVEVPQSIMYVQPTQFYMAKDQAGLGVPFISNPTVTKMLDLIAKNTAATDNQT